MNDTITDLDIDAIEAALRNPATSQLIERDEIGHEGDALAYGTELRQLIPLAEHARPWVLITTEAGERTFKTHDSLRAAEADYVDDLDALRAEWAEIYGDDYDEDED